MNNFNKGISTANFPDILKSIKVKIVFKKSLKMKKESRSKVFPVTSKTFENFIYIYIYIYIYILTHSFRNICVDFEKATVQGTNQLL